MESTPGRVDSGRVDPRPTWLQADLTRYHVCWAAHTCSLSFFLSFSIYCLTLAFEHYRQVYIVHSTSYKTNLRCEVVRKTDLGPSLAPLLTTVKRICWFISHGLSVRFFGAGALLGLGGFTLMVLFMISTKELFLFQRTITLFNWADKVVRNTGFVNWIPRSVDCEYINFKRLY